MTYYSPFAALFADSNAPDRDLEYIGTLDSVLSDVAALSPYQTAPILNACVWALHPPRIIRAVVDYKIQNPSPEIEMLLKEAIDASLGVYSDPANSTKTVGKLRNKIKTLGLEALLTASLNQPGDEPTWIATAPLHSQNATLRLASKILYDDMLFIALAHGGIAAGMDVYLRYCDFSRSKDSAFYAARLSTQKLKDEQPRLSASEINYLRKLAENRQVVVFDEDSASGRTIKIARDYFSAIFSNQSVITLVNLGSKDAEKVAETNDGLNIPIMGPDESIKRKSDNVENVEKIQNTILANQCSFKTVEKIMSEKLESYLKGILTRKQNNNPLGTIPFVSDGFDFLEQNISKMAKSLTF